MTRVPLTFDPHDWDEHLEFSETAGVTEVRWPALGLSVFVRPGSEPRRSPTREELLGTPQLRFLGHSGFSLGRYTEVFVFPPHGIYSDEDHPELLYFRMGEVEGSIGQVTPLAHYLFDYGHDDDFSGEFSSFYSMRLTGVTHDNAELVTLSALALLQRDHDLSLATIQLGNHRWSDDLAAANPEQDRAPSSDDGPADLRLPNGFAELEPLRMLLRGRDEPTPEVAFLQFYRVLEYFSIFCNEEKAEALRSNRGLTTRQFLQELTQLMARDEKAGLGRLLAEIADAKVLAMAAEAKLIDRQAAAALTDALYGFRNSIVHAKDDRNARLFTLSIFDEPIAAVAWRRTCEALAWSALERFGTRTG